MQTLFKYYLRVMMFLLPVMFLPVMVDPFGVGKNWMLLTTAIIGLIIWTIGLLTDKKAEVKFNAFLPWMALLLVWGGLSWWFREPAGVRMRSIDDTGGFGTMIGMFVYFWLWLQNDRPEERNAQVNFLTAGGVLTALTSIIVFMLPAAKMPISWPKDNPFITLNSQWSLAGSLLNESILGVFLVIEWGRRLLSKLKKDGEGYLIEAGMLSFLTLGLLLSLFRLFKTGFVNLDGNTAWTIGAEVFKRSPIWGAGVGDFMEAFSAFRPATYNLTKYWSNGFKFSSMGVLEIWTDLGLVGLGLAVIMAVIFVRQKKNFVFLRNAVVGLIATFLPFNFISLLLLTWILATSAAEAKKAELRINAGANGFNIAPYIVGVLILGVSVFSGYWMYRIVMGEFFMRQSLVAAAKNDGGTTYNQQIKAIGYLPELAEYRRIYSQTNMALATTLLSNKDISDDDKQKASVLIQQAVREGKAAISLEPNNSNYWLNLAAIYRQLIGVVDGSADWSFQAYQQAVALEPANPVSKLEMGGLLYAANRFDEADRVFEQVVQTKNDYANGWYNWAYSAKQLNRLADAVQRMNQAVTLVPADSGDFEKANQDLADWKKQLDALTKQAQEQQQKQAETLTQPQPMPTVSKEEKVNVPTGEMAPPTPAATMTPTPSPTGAATTGTVTPTKTP